MPRAAYDGWLTNLPAGSERCLLHIQSVPSIFLLLARRKRQSDRMSTKKGLIGILTGGGDVPGLNPAIRAVTIRALREGYQVVGIRHGWLGAISIVRDEHADNSEHFQILTEEIVNRAARTGGTFLHTSRTNPSAVKKEEVPEALRATFNQDKNDLTSEVIKNLDWLGIDYLIPIGGDDTLSFATRLSKEGVKVVAIPKTMDNDVPGTDYCIGFSTCVSRTIELSNRLRTSAGWATWCRPNLKTVPPNTTRASRSMSSTSVSATWCAAAIPTRLIRSCPWPTEILPSISSCMAATGASSS